MFLFYVLWHQGTSATLRRRQNTSPIKKATPRKAGKAARFTGSVKKKTASELAEMVATRIGISAAAIKVMPDPVHGWRAMVIGPRTTVSKYQPQADRIREELCTQYELER